MSTVVHIITGLDDGGAEAVLYRLCLNDKDNDHHVITLMDEGKYGPLLRNAGINVLCLNMPRGRLTPGGLLRLYRLLRGHRRAIVQTWMYHADLVGGLVARLAGNRCVCWGVRHGDLGPDSRRSTIFIARLSWLFSSFLPRYIVCCAHRAAEVNQRFGYEKEKFVIIPNGYDTEQFQPDASVRDRVRT